MKNGVSKKSIVFAMLVLFVGANVISGFQIHSSQ